LSNLKKSLEYLNLTKFKKSTPEEAFYYWTLNLKGLTSFYLGEIEDSLDYLQQIIGDHKEDESYTQAVLNYGVFSRNSGIEKYEKVSITFFEKIINEIGYKNEKLSDDFLNEVKSIAYYNIAQIHAKAEHFEKAIENYEHSLSIARLEVKPILLLGLYYIEEKNTRKEEIIAEIVNIIKENNLQPIEFDIDKQLDFNTEQLQEILTITFIHSYSEFEKLKPWLQFLGEKTYAEYIYELFLFSISHKQDWNTGFALLSNIYDNFDNREYGIDEKIKYNTLQILAYIDAEKSEEYISLFSVRRLKKIDYIDFSIFANLITGLIEQKKYDDSLKYIQVINSVKNEVDNELIINYLSILNLELNTYYLLKENDTAIEKAKEILTLCNDTTIKKQKSNLLGDKGLEIVRKNAEAILYTQSRNQHPIRVEKKYGPNEWVKVRYTDGRIENKKYKKVKDDLNNNKCTIITNE
ncbi:MAG TPA: hypothetical protein DD434_04780, partial [Bacteroidales bacterium]|nr:hypothetical protein [Bacteroidales bacterium]